MPTIKSNLKIASSGEKVPGDWLFHIPAVVSLPNRDDKPGIEITTVKSGKSYGAEMWKCCGICIDPLPEAPQDAICFFNLIWNGDKSEEVAYRLFKLVGHPVEEWQQITDPAKAVVVAPEHLYNRPFVLAVTVNAQGYLEPAGFNPFLPATAPRGVKQRATKEKGGGGSSSGSGAPASSPASSGGGSSAGGEADLPF